MSVTYLDKDLEQALSAAKRDFAEHEVRQEGSERWAFIRPRAHPHRGMYWMRIITAPDMVMAYGDCEEIIFLKSLDWLRAQVTSDRAMPVSYLWEKVPHRLRRGFTEFSMERVREYLREEEQDLCEEWDVLSLDEVEAFSEDDYARRQVKYLREMKERSSTGWETAHDFYESWYSASAHHRLGTDEFPTVKVMSHQFLFLLGMFREFFAQIPDQPPVVPSTG